MDAENFHSFNFQIIVIVTVAIVLIVTVIGSISSDTPGKFFEIFI